MGKPDIVPGQPREAARTPKVRMLEQVAGRVALGVGLVAAATIISFDKPRVGGRNIRRFSKRDPGNAKLTDMSMAPTDADKIAKLVGRPKGASEPIVEIPVHTPSHKATEMFH